jgi:hypothetical protein
MVSLAALTNGRDLDRNPRTGMPLLLMLKVDVALLSKISFGEPDLIACHIFASGWPSVKRLDPGVGDTGNL